MTAIGHSERERECKERKKKSETQKGHIIIGWCLL